MKQYENDPYQKQMEPGSPDQTWTLAVGFDWPQTDEALFIVLMCELQNMPINYYKPSSNTWIMNLNIIELSKKISSLLKKSSIKLLIIILEYISLKKKFTTVVLYNHAIQLYKADKVMQWTQYSMDLRNRRRVWNIKVGTVYKTKA
jgi:hypothetical protein